MRRKQIWLEKHVKVIYLYGLPEPMEESLENGQWKEADFLLWQWNRIWLDTIRIWIVQKCMTRGPNRHRVHSKPSTALRHGARRWSGRSQTNQLSSKYAECLLKYATTYLLTLLKQRDRTSIHLSKNIEVYWRLLRIHLSQLKIEVVRINRTCMGSPLFNT